MLLSADWSAWLLRMSRHNDAGVVMFISFSIFGLLPLAGFVAWLTVSGSSTDGRLAFMMACAVSGIALFILGFFKVRQGSGFRV